MNYILGGGGLRFAPDEDRAQQERAGLRNLERLRRPQICRILRGRYADQESSANEALQLIIEQLRDMQEHPVSDAELASAKKYLIGSFPLKLDHQSSIASFSLQVELYGLGLDYIERSRN